MESVKKTDSSSEKTNKGKKDTKTTVSKEARLAAALRENLRKRKQQQRDRAQDHQPHCHEKEKS